MARAIIRKRPGSGPAGVPTTATAPDIKDSAIDELLKFIPTEVVGVFTALVALVPQHPPSLALWAPRVLFILGLVLTPVVLWLDSLIPRIEAWLTVQDLDRRRAAELVRFHLRESTPQMPSLLGARQLRLVAQFASLEDELEQEWQRRPQAVWTPRRLLARSRMAAQYRRVLTATIGGLVLALAALLLWTWQSARARRDQEALQRDRDLGRFELVLAPFDWRLGPRGLEQVPVSPAALPQLSWRLHEPADDDPGQPGQPVSAQRLRHGQVELRDGVRLEHAVEARGGDAFLLISGRGRSGEACPPSILRLQRLPGYATRGQKPPTLRIDVPTCQASRFDTIEIPAGPFVAGGPGEPPSSFAAHELPPEDPARWLDTYSIDRTEITNAAYAVFAEHAALTGLIVVAYPDNLPSTAAPRSPRTDLSAFDAAAYCAYLGKRLPSNDEWQKALRGGLRLPDGTTNPAPRRNLPWPPLDGGARTPAHLRDTAPQDEHTGALIDGPRAVDANPDDRSPYGVLGLAGNVHEWTRSPVRAALDQPARPGQLPMRITRGGNWATTTSEDLVNYMVLENERSPRQVNYYLGARCVLWEGSSATHTP